MPQLMRDAGPLMYGTRRVELNGWMGRVFALSDVTEHLLYSLWLPAPESTFFCQEGMIRRRLAATTFKNGKNKSPGLLATVTWFKGAAVHANPGLTISCSTLTM